MVGEVTQSCRAGIERLDVGSNSLDTYNAAKAGSGKWEDSGFPATDDSLFWTAWGTSANYKPPAGLVWKRPEEMGAWDGTRYIENW